MKPTQEQFITRYQYNQLFHEVGLHLSAFKAVNDCDEEILKLVNAACALAYEAGRKDENEACAKVCDEIYTGDEAAGDWPTPEMCAEAIRARIEQ